MKLLLISDHENSFLWDYYVPGRLDGIDLILSCGDLKPRIPELPCDDGARAGAVCLRQSRRAL